MSRTEIQYRVPYADTDQMAVVYYGNYLTYFERVRNEMLRDAGLPYTSFEAAGLMLPVVEAHCQYKAPALYDDVLTISAAFTMIRGCRLRIENEIHNEAGQLLAKGYTLHAFMDAQTRKPAKPPESITKTIESRLLGD